MKMKKMIKGMLTFVVALSIFIGLGKVEVQAEEKYALDLQSGDILKPGDVITYDGRIIMNVIYGDVSNDLIAEEENSVTIKNSYLSRCYSGSEIINLGIDFVSESERDGEKQVYIGLYGHLVEAGCEHKWKVMEDGESEYHMIECEKCGSIYYSLHTYENDVCTECETGSLVEEVVVEEEPVVEEVPVEEAITEEYVVEESVEEEVVVEESVEEEVVVEESVEEEVVVEESIAEEPAVEEAEANKGMPVGAAVGVGAVVGAGLYFGMKKFKK